jgi:hypothetical protein
MAAAAEESLEKGIVEQRVLRPLIGARRVDVDDGRLRLFDDWRKGQVLFAGRSWGLPRGVRRRRTCAGERAKQQRGSGRTRVDQRWNARKERFCRHGSLQ